MNKFLPKSCCSKNLNGNRRFRVTDKVVFPLPRKFSRSQCLRGVRGFTFFGDVREVAVAVVGAPDTTYAWSEPCGRVYSDGTERSDMCIDNSVALKLRFTALKANIRVCNFDLDARGVFFVFNRFCIDGRCDENHTGPAQYLAYTAEQTTKQRAMKTS